MAKIILPVLLLEILVLSSCKDNSTPTKEMISQINLKRGEIISCGPPGKEFGHVDFEVSCKGAKMDFDLAMELLHSFEYDESEKVFAKIIDVNPDCAMAYWGVAMCNFHALWNPPTEAELQKGSKAINIAKSIAQKDDREAAYIDAIGEFYKDWDKKDHITRCLNFEKAMEKVYISYPKDIDAAIFYALALDAAAAPTDKTYAKQKKAGAILDSLYPKAPDHPGILHYIIHTYDYPGLAELALPAARKYAQVAPSSAHALHMPSHIFTRLGLWDECIQSNLVSVASAKCYAQSAGIKGHWDEELHGLDYLVYAYLQKGQIDSARKQVEYLDTINEVYPANFKVAYAYAAIPSRFALETGNWEAAAALPIYPSNFPWNNFPWQEAIVHFTRAMGSIHTGKIANAETEISRLSQLYDTLNKQKDVYKAKQVLVKIKTCEAWIQFVTGKKKEGLQLMTLAADMEDSTGKHPVTPGEVLPARELLGTMLNEMGEPAKALEAYEEVLKKSPNRNIALGNAVKLAAKLGYKEKAAIYLKQYEKNCRGFKY
jgi:tetratricopeptide (TPR) repeat protein